MDGLIRNARPDERHELERLLERCYGCSRGAFSRWQPQHFLDAEAFSRWHLVLELGGRLVSNVGGYPLETVLGPARTMTAGVGNVGTDPQFSGRGYMSALLKASIACWRERGWTLSALWGDRQRYGAFGWETCGLKYTLSVTHRSLERHGICAGDIEEVDRLDPSVVERARALHATLPYRVERPDLGLKLSREGVRVFLGPDGYLLSRGDYGELQVSEIVSPTGREPELIAGALQWARTGSARVEVGAGELERLARVTQVMSGWSAGPQGQLRILSWPGVLRDLRPLLTERAAGLPSFAVCIGCWWQDETEWATVEWDGEAVEVSEGQRSAAIEIGLPTLTGLLLGSPHPAPPELGLFGRLLPVPLHLPLLDHV